MHRDPRAVPVPWRRGNLVHFIFIFGFTLGVIALVGCRRENPPATLPPDAAAAAPASSDTSPGGVAGTVMPRAVADTDTTTRAVQGAKPTAGQAGEATATEYEGWRQYSVNCARCHGDDAVGGVMAPDLRGSVARGAASSGAFQTIVRDGRREKGMPGFKAVLSDQQIEAIYAYVEARAKGRIPAGRPQEPQG